MFVLLVATNTADICISLMHVLASVVQTGQDVRFQYSNSDFRRRWSVDGALPHRNPTLADR